MREVAQSAAELLEAESGAVTLMVEEGRFLKVKAATGALEVGHRHAGSSGWLPARLGGESGLRTGVGRHGFRPSKLPAAPFRCRSSRLPSFRFGRPASWSGTVSVYNRRDRQPFSQTRRSAAADSGRPGGGGPRPGVGAGGEPAQRGGPHEARTRSSSGRLSSRASSWPTCRTSCRTPLNAIIGFSDLLLEGGGGEISAQQREFIEAVLRNGKHLLTLINSVLDLSKVEAGRMSLTLGVTDLREAIACAVTDTASLRTAKQQECVLKLDPASLTVVADGVRIRQILYNLLSNASKFTAEGGKICSRGSAHPRATPAAG